LISTVLAALAMMVASAAVFAGGASAYSNYVSLGDSYIAGSGILPIVTDSAPLSCTQSYFNFPHLLDRRFQFSSFADASCGAAVTGNMTGNQNDNPPQFDRLQPDTDLVTLGIGGNDIGLVGLAISCVSPFSPFGSPCKNSHSNYISNDVAGLKPKVADVVNGIHTRSPGAKVLVVGYPKVIRRGGCWPKIPVTAGDATWLDDIIVAMNRALKAAAVENGAKYVDIFTSSTGHDMCQLPGVRWVEGLTPIGSLAFFHPNALSHYNAYVKVRAAAGL
ncbi:MAG: SGNH/GDSL hydrolase family protein, partial [Thermoleophilaceae bacterium]|nr:SGNH/GDSL hydrolase family protein [Thermoleophilaceae bacterium]